LLSDGDGFYLWAGLSEATRNQQIFDYMLERLEESGDSDYHTKRIRECIDAGNVHDACRLFAEWWGTRFEFTTVEVS
jgi:hypothetical protein